MPCTAEECKTILGAREHLSNKGRPHLAKIVPSRVMWLCRTYCGNFGTDQSNLLFFRSVRTSPGWSSFNKEDERKDETKISVAFK